MFQSRYPMDPCVIVLHIGGAFVPNWNLKQMKSKYQSYLRWLLGFKRKAFLTENKQWCMIDTRIKNLKAPQIDIIIKQWVRFLCI